MEVVQQLQPAMIGRVEPLVLQRMLGPVKTQDPRRCLVYDLVETVVRALRSRVESPALRRVTGRTQHTEPVVDLESRVLVDEHRRPAVAAPGIARRALAVDHAPHIRISQVQQLAVRIAPPGIPVGRKQPPRLILVNEVDLPEKGLRIATLVNVVLVARDQQEAQIGVEMPKPLENNQPHPRGTHVAGLRHREIGPRHHAAQHLHHRTFLKRIRDERNHARRPAILRRVRPDKRVHVEQQILRAHQTQIRRVLRPLGSQPKRLAPVSQIAGHITRHHAGKRRLKSPRVKQFARDWHRYTPPEMVAGAGVEPATTEA